MKIRPFPSPALPFPALLALLAASALAQQAPAPSVPPSNPPADQPPVAPASPQQETVVLSPFEVVMSKSNGFVAATSLAGTRLMTDLKDTPAAYSVITSEFIDALGITNMNDATNWTVGAFYSPDNNSNQGFSIIQFNVIRGTAPGQSQYPTRNFFPDNVISDSYNLDQYEYGRGSNSILFGSSAFGGNANAVTKQALLNQSIDTLKVSYGSWGQERVTADVNQPIGSKAAIRADLLWSNNYDWSSGSENAWRDGNTSRKKAAFLTGTWEPLPGTEIRLDAEYGELTQVLALATLTDEISGWDGKTINPTYNPTLSLTSAQKLSEGVTTYGNSFVYNPAGSGSNIVNYSNTLETQPGGAVGSLIGGVPVAGNIAIQTGAPMLYAQNLPQNRFGTDASGSPAFYLPGRAFNAGWNSGPTFTQNFKNATLTVDRHFGDFLYFQIAGEVSKESAVGQNAINRGSQSVYLDLNQQLPTGAPNPNFLQPYTQASIYKEPRWVDFRNLRGALAYIKETPLGKFTVNGLAGLQWQLQENRAYEEIVPLTLPGTTLNAADLRTIAFGGSSNQDVINYRYYWNQTQRSLFEFHGPINVINPITGQNQSVTPMDLLDSARTDNNSGTHTNYKYLQAAVTDKIWGDKLVLFGALRRDYYEFINRGSRLPMDYPTGWNGQQIIFKPDAPANYYNLMYYPLSSTGQITGPLQPAQVRPRDANGVPLPQYAGDVFQNDFNPPFLTGAINTVSFGAVYNVNPWLGAYADSGQTFTLPQANAVNFSGSLMPPTVSRSYDTGLRFHLMGGALELTLGGYQERNKNAEVGALGVTDNNNIFLVPSASDPNPTVDTSGLGRQLPTVTFDTVDQSSKGLELEATANLTTHWRLMGNFTDSRTYQDNADAGFLGYYGANVALMKQALTQAGITISPTTNQATVNNLSAANNTANQATNAANAWNDLVNNVIPGVVSGRVEFVGSMEMRGNLFTDYAFDEGLVKGLRVGGGMQYFGKEVLGTDASEQGVNPASPSTSILIGNPYQIIYAPTYWLGVATLDYRWVLNERRSIDFRLVVNNLFNYGQPVYYVNVPGSNANDLALRPPDGNLADSARVPTPNNYYYVAPRSFIVTATFNF